MILNFTDLKLLGGPDVIKHILKIHTHCGTASKHTPRYTGRPTCEVSIYIFTKAHKCSHLQYTHGFFLPECDIRCSVGGVEFVYQRTDSNGVDGEFAFVTCIA